MARRTVRPRPSPPRPTVARSATPRGERTIVIGRGAVVGSALIAVALVAALALTLGLRSGRAAALVAPWWAVPNVPPAAFDALDPDVQLAIADARADVAEIPSSAAAWRGLGMVFDAHALWAPAEAAYRRAVQLAPRDAAAAYYLANVTAVVRPTDPETERRYRRAIALDPAYAPGWLRLADVYAANGRTADAVEAFRAAISAYGPPERTALARRSLGQALLNAGDVDGAVAELEAVARVRGDDRVTVAALAQAYQRRGETAKAEAAAAEAERLTQTLGESMGDFDPLRDAMLARSALGSQIRQRIDAQLAAGDTAGALTAALEWEQRHPDWPSIKVLVGDIYARLGRSADARRYFEAADRLAAQGHTR